MRKPSIVAYYLLFLIIIITSAPVAPPSISHQVKFVRKHRFNMLPGTVPHVSVDCIMQRPNTHNSALSCIISSLIFSALVDEIGKSSTNCYIARSVRVHSIRTDSSFEVYLYNIIKDLHRQSPQDRDFLSNLASPPVSPLTWNHRCRYNTPIRIDEMHDEKFDVPCLGRVA